MHILPCHSANATLTKVRARVSADAMALVRALRQQEFIPNLRFGASTCVIYNKNQKCLSDGKKGVAWFYEGDSDRVNGQHLALLCASVQIEITKKTKMCLTNIWFSAMIDGKVSFRRYFSFSLDAS